LYKSTDAYGLRFTYHASDTGIGPILAQYGEFSRVQLDLLNDYVAHAGRRGAFLDIGANIGAICAPLAAANPDLRVIAVEANAHTASVLAANAVNNGLANIEIVHAAAGRTSGLIDFPTLKPGMSASFGEVGMHMAGRLPTEKVRLCSLDEIAPADTRLVKIDVEGFEGEVLAGASHLINHVRPVWSIEANPQARAVTHAAMSTMLAADYRLFWLLTPFVSPAPYRDAAPARWTLDLNFMALPAGQPNLWDLPEIVDPGAPWVTERRAYRFLERYRTPS
jgi:FkbM family methyltransferase